MSGVVGCNCTPVVRVKRPESVLAELLSIAAWEYLEITRRRMSREFTMKARRDGERAGKSEEKIGERLDLVFHQII